MARFVLFTQNTMASVVASRILLQRHPQEIVAIVLASQFRGESWTDQLKIISTLTQKSSWGFFFYKLLESKIYPWLLTGHRLFRTSAYQQGKALGIEELARQQKIPILRTNDLNAPEFLQEVKELHPDFILCLIAQILKKNTFASLGNRFINAHGSYLPEYRGPAQYIWYLLENRQEFGVTIHFMKPGIDTGEIILQQKFPFSPDISAYRLHYLLAVQFGEMLSEFVKLAVTKQSLPQMPQDEAKATVTRLPTREDLRRFRQQGKKLLSVKDFLYSF